MSTYLVTGGAGFIGSHLCEALLKDGHTVVNADNFSDTYDYRFKVRNVLETLGMSPAFDYREKDEDLSRLRSLVRSERYRLEIADIRDGSAVEALFRTHKPDAVVHLAAMPGVRASIADPLLFEDVNVRGTLQLLERMRAHGVRKWVCASSSSVYGNNRKIPFAEADPVEQPISLYAATKRSCELMAYTYSHLFGIDGMVLRFFTVYGERQRPDLAIRKFAERIERGEPIPFYGDGSTSRDYTYVADIVRGIRSAIRYVERHEDVCEIVNLGGNRTVSLARMVETLEKEWGAQAKLDRQPMQPGDVERTCADLTKAKKLLGYEPSTGFEEGIRKFAAWLKAELAWQRTEK
ncbi:GDP-mannose 4,6-dehydratase [Cohnella thermotolerans]|uniref:GDP-mannose 4,6-dehydratase n=1 Tax=Cohnella thermotolerans TaxID=329858 RepID=UPI00040F146F|nr:GDP-mannose 4,6-dehydratase [Cohnella thermotolerans]